MIEKFMVIIWLGYNYEQPVQVGLYDDCDTGRTEVKELYPEHKAFGCFTKAHWDKHKHHILSW